MRLSIPKLSQFFHRRSKSDPALSRRLAPSPARRPLSASILEGLAHLHLPPDFNLPLDGPSGSSRSLPSELLARVPTTPVALPPSHSNPHPHPRPVSLATLSSTASATSSAASGASSSTTISAASHTVVVEVLTRRIQELEAELETTRRPLRDAGDASTVAGSESELARLRARDASTPSAQNTLAECALGGPTDNQADGCTPPVHQQEGSDSDTVGTRPPPESAGRAGGPPTNTDILLSLLTPCAERAMLDDAYRRVLAGDDPEDALVDAIRAAAAVHGSTWRRLLAPVVGTPAPEAYAAQVRCTLAARRETRGWRTRAAFWRASARLDGGHKETVTPSASQLSDVVRELEAGEGARKLKGKEVQPVQVRVEVSVQTQTDALPEELEVDSDPTPRPPAVMRLGVPREKIPSVQQIFATPAAITTADASSHATVAPHENLLRNLTPPRKAGTASTSTSPVRTSLGAYGNLPPLASVAFRESYSISSRKELVGLSASASSSSQESRVSQKRKGVILEASSSDLQSQTQAQARSQARVPSTGSLETDRLGTTGSLSGAGPISDSSSGAGSVAGSGSGSGLGSGAISGTGISDSGSSERTARTDSPVSTGSWDRLSSFMARSFSFGFGFGSTLQDTLAVETSDAAPGAHTPAPSHKPKVKANPSFTLNPNVSINPSPTPVPSRRPDPLPERPPPSPTPAATRTTTTRARTPSPLSSANSSPAKSPKSRLPLPVGGGTPSPTRVAPPPKRTFMKRLSLAISKPVLVDSTNAAALVVGAGAGAGSGAGVAAGRYGLMQKRGAQTQMQTMAPVKEAGTGTVGMKRRAEASPEKAKAGGKKTGGWDKGKKARVDENENANKNVRQGVSQQSKGKAPVRTRLMRKQA